MTKRMLIDATHAEETRVVVLDGTRLEDFDVETAAKKQLKGNIYLAKVVRVEPSLQAAFVEYGGGRHGFLAFGEIHPDYYQIPVADRQRLLELQEAEARAEEEAEDAAAAADEAAERAAPALDEDHAPQAPLGLHDEDAIPGHAPSEAMLAEPGHDAGLPDERTPGQGLPSPGMADEGPTDAHVLAEPVDPPYGEQDAISAAIAAETPSEPDEPLGVEPGPEEPRTLAAAIEQDIVVGVDSYAPGAGHPSESLSAELAPPPGAESAPEASGADMAPEAGEPALFDAPEAQQGAFPEADPEADPEANGTDPAFEPAAPPQSAGARGAPEEDAREEAREDEPREARAPARYMRSYKIQEVIRRRQILLIQVVKEERGSKGAALTTFISLAGRFSVLMPNSPRGGGISRKITSATDRRRLKEVTSELQIPRGMGLIVRTAGANRPKAEIKRDCEYLLELWDSIRETTMKSVAPALIHEEASLIKRSIRDNYSRDVDEVLVDGEAGWRAARDFMRMLMPAHARKVVLWNDPQPLFARQAVEAQLDAMLVPTVQLKSGGYLVINQTEALVAIDVNSGRSTRERGIEETALKTNLEAADEVARQLRLRDLAGLIVIDFIDMENRRNNAAVEKRMKDALKDDRARIQIGAISSFGLMEMSRQRLRPSLAETSFTPCPHCGGTGHVRSTETSALAVLRAIEDEGAKRRAAEICVHVAGAIALYVLNHKRVRLAEIEARYGMTVSFAADETLLAPQTRIERLRAQVPGDMPELPTATLPAITHAADVGDDDVEEEDDEVPETGAESDLEPAEAAPPGESEGETRKRRRRRRGGRREDGVAEAAPVALQAADPVDPALAEQPDLPTPPPELGALDAAAEEARSRRRGRRGGRRRRRDEPDNAAAAEPSADDDTSNAPASFDAPPAYDPPAYDPPAYSPPAYTGPTPADPFGGGVFDIYDVMEQAEARAAATPASPPPPPIEAPPRPDAEAAAGEATVPSEIPAVAAHEVAAIEKAASPMEIAPPGDEAAAIVSITAEAAVEPIQGDGAGLPAPEEAASPGKLIPEAVPGVGEAVQAVPLQYAAEEVLPEPPPQAEPASEPVSAPVLVGAGDMGTEKKRGWWRR